MPARRRRDMTAIPRLAPLLVALLGALAASAGAALRGLPPPLDLVGVFLIIGLVTTWLARATPLRGALFLLILTTIVIVIVYGG